MRNQAPGHDQLTARLKHFIVASLKLRGVTPDNIADDEPIIGGNLGLDSLDALSLAVCVEEEFGITIDSKADFYEAFASVARMAEFIEARTPAFAAVGHSAVPMQISA